MIEKYKACVSKVGSDKSQIVTMSAVQYELSNLKEMESLYEDEEYARVHGMVPGKRIANFGDYFVAFKVNGEMHLSFVPKKEFEFVVSLGEPIYMTYDTDLD